MPYWQHLLEGDNKWFHRYFASVLCHVTFVIDQCSLNEVGSWKQPHRVSRHRLANPFQYILQWSMFRIIFQQKCTKSIIYMMSFRKYYPESDMIINFICFPMHKENQRTIKTNYANRKKKKLNHKFIHNDTLITDAKPIVNVFNYFFIRTHPGKQNFKLRHISKLPLEECKCKYSVSGTRWRGGNSWNFEIIEIFMLYISSSIENGKSCAYLQSWRYNEIY